MPVTRKANTPAKKRQWHDVERSAKARGASPRVAVMEADAVVRDHPAKWEGSKADRIADKTGAKKAGMTTKAYEKSAKDRKADAEMQRAMDKR